MCLSEQWLKNNKISDFDSEFSDFKKIAKDFAMTIIPDYFPFWSNNWSDN